MAEPDLNKMREIAHDADLASKKPGYDKAIFDALREQAKVACGDAQQLLDFMVIFDPDRVKTE